MTDGPGRISSILFACTMNSVRSPMAEGVAKSLLGRRVHIDSAGLRKTERDPFVLAVLNEIGIDFSDDDSHTVQEIGLDGFDLVVTLSREATDVMAERARTLSIRHLAWKIDDPTLAGGSREARLAAYRAVRDTLQRMIRQEVVPLVRRVPSQG